MSDHYSSGGPRVHASSPVDRIARTIEEYERRGRDGTLSPDVSADLLACATDLREELAMREAEAALGYVH